MRGSNGAKSIAGTSGANGRATPKRFPVYTIPELLAGDFRPQWLVKGVLVEGQPCIVAGASKCLKTSLLVDMAVSLAHGGRFLGRFAVPAAVRVGMMSGESGLATLRETIIRVCRAAGIDPAALSNLIVSAEVPRVAKQDHLDALERFVREHKLSVLMIDPAYQAMGDAASEMGNLFAVGEVLRGLVALCQTAGTTLILCHHNRKGSGANGDAPELSDIAWAGFGELARQWILVARRERYQGDGRHRLYLNMGGSAGHGSQFHLDVEEGVQSDDFDGRRWEVTLTSAAQAQAHAATEKSRRKSEERERLEAGHVQRLAAVLKDLPDGDTASQLRDAAGLKAPDFSKAVATLKASGEVEPCRIVKGNSRDYPGFRWKATRNESEPLGTTRNATVVPTDTAHSQDQGPM
ncbi:MAG: AAA family ATPase [Pirellulales bacterium]